MKQNPDREGGGRDFTYQVVRSSRRKTADIVLERDGRLVVRVPHELPAAQIDQLLDAKRLWIHRNLAEWRELNAARVAREFRNGEGFLYLGRSYRLLLADGNEPLSLKAGRFCLRRDLARTESEARSAFIGYYTGRGLQRLPARVAYYAPKVGVTPGRLGIRELGYRWASCSPHGNLAFHWKCMMAPMTVIDYLVVHELCHLRILDHTQAFWNEVDKILPDYRERKDWLKKNGAALDV